ncbi:hypothetical protein V9T40_000493 [Parthenolecanium corni]|uniref:Cytochrome P450 n=1 Tax=Parthenolecanium corni TaxID=536013 RepID=A0AAN9TCZ7_9HEMI
MSRAAYGERTKKAFLDMLLDASEKDNHSLSVQDIREEVDTFMFEGHDTTSAALGWVIFSVGNHPDVQQKIYEELDEIFGNSDRPPNNNDLARMKYLECVLKEAMRLFPPVPVLSRRLVVDTKMGDYNLPENTTVLIHVHHIHRSAKYFPNPEQFNPANFSSYRESHLNPYGYIPFSAGPRNCIGQKFAMIEEKILLSAFFRKFAVDSVEKMENIISAPDTILRATNGIFVVLSASAHINKPITYKFLEPWLGTGLITSSGSLWHHRRQILTPAFHFSTLEKFFDPIVENSRLMVRMLESEIDSPKFDLVPFITDCSLHNICETAMGVKMSETSEVKKKYLENVQTFLESVYYRTMNPFIHLDAMYKLTNTYKKTKQAVEEMHEVAMTVIEKRIIERKRRHQTEKDTTIKAAESVYSRQKEFLDILLDVSESSERPLTMEEIRNEVDTFLFAGHDTVSIALSMVLYFLGLYPDIQKKVHAEVDQLLGDADAPANSKVLLKFNYLECVIKESMRLHPVAPMIMRIVGEDMTIGI